MDLRFTLRSMRKNPGFSLLAVLVMAIGIGANTAVFSVVNSVLLKPLPYPDPERIVTLECDWTKDPDPISPYVSAPDYRDWRQQSTAFEAMAYYQPHQTSVRAAASAAEFTGIASVTPDFFEVFAVQPAKGRLFTASENGAVISQAFWRRNFGGASDAIGKTVHVYERTLTVTGIMPGGFEFPEHTGVWFAANTIFPERDNRGAHNYLVLARLKPDVSLEQAQTQMRSIAARLARQYPQNDDSLSVAVTRMRDRMVGNVRFTLEVLLGAVAMVLLIACANVANLLLAKATARSREIAIRAAVGASRSRIARQLVTESLVLGGVAGAVGLLLSVWAKDALVQLASDHVPRLADTATDVRVLAFTFLASMLSSLLFGLAPAWQASRADLQEALKRSGTRAASGGGKIRSALVVAEIAMSVMLPAAGLLLKSFVALENVALGYRTDRVLVMKASVPASTEAGSREAVGVYRNLLTQIAGMPGVSAVGATQSLPGSVNSEGTYWVDAKTGPQPGLPSAINSVVAPGTFDALGIPLKSGRDFDDRDNPGALGVAIINETLMRTSFPPGQDPIGHIIFAGHDDADKPLRIIGVAGDVRQEGPQTPPAPQIYLPYQQHPRSAAAINIVVRTTGEPATWFEALRKSARQASPDMSVQFTTMNTIAASKVATPKFRTVLLSLFAGLAICLAMAGIYGVMAYTVSQRTGEIGVRMALGAQTIDVLRLILGQGTVLAATGLALGLAGSAVTSRLLSSILYKVKPFDPVTYGAVGAIAALSAIGAILVPARRASKLDPLVALRHE